MKFLIPLFLSFLFLNTTVYAQELDEIFFKEHDSINKDLSDSELIEKLYNELVDLSESGMSKDKISAAVYQCDRKYIDSRTEYYRHIAYWKFLKIPKEETPESYEVHRKSKNTKQGIVLWELNNAERAERLWVFDLHDLNASDSSKIANKLLKVKQHEILNKLFVSDGHDYITIHENDGYEFDTTMVVNYRNVDEVPLLPKCSKLPSQDLKRDCVSQEISMHFTKKFNTDLPEELGLEGRIVISVIFTIGEDGSIIKALARAPHPKLEEEAKRVSYLLPKFRPGKLNGKTVKVSYSLPIVYSVN